MLLAGGRAQTKAGAREPVLGRAQRPIWPAGQAALLQIETSPARSFPVPHPHPTVFVCFRRAFWATRLPHPSSPRGWLSQQLPQEDILWPSVGKPSLSSRSAHMC